MKLSGWVRLWIVMSVIWWAGAGSIAAMTLSPGWKLAVENPPPQPTPLTAEWIEENYRHVPDYTPLIGPIAFVVLLPFVLALAFIGIRWTLLWIWRGFFPKKASAGSP